MARLAWQAGIKAQVGYKRRPDSYCGTPSVVIDNTLDRQFAVSASCLLYTSDAADDLLCVDLGGRRIIKKKKQKQEQEQEQKTGI